MTAVYVIQAEGGPVKIGVAAAPQKRLAALRTGTPFPLSLAHVQDVDDLGAVAVERAAHALLAAARTHGEWFNVSAEEAREAISAAIETLRDRTINDGERPKTTAISSKIAVETKEALAKAAKDDRRSLASMTDKILTDWLKEKGYLQAGAASQ